MGGHAGKLRQVLQPQSCPFVEGQDMYGVSQIAIEYSPTLPADGFPESVAVKFAFLGDKPFQLVQFGS